MNLRRKIEPERSRRPAVIVTVFGTGYRLRGTALRISLRTRVFLTVATVLAGAIAVSALLSRRATLVEVLIRSSRNRSG